MAVSRLQRSRIAPWSGLIAGMLAEIVHHQLLSDMLRFDCRLGGASAGLAVGIPALALIALGIAMSWAAVRGADPDAPHSETRRFIAQVSGMMGGLLAIAIVWQTMATMIVPACAP
jgi:membrane associated rhomboid family serine protease